MTTLGIGVIGCGTISATYLRLLPRFAGLAVRAVADIDPAAAARRSGEFGIPARAVDALITANDIDIILNLTSPDQHYSVSRRSLESGKHVYSEKPLALTLADGLQLKRCAAERGLRIAAAPDTFLGAAHQQARACIDACLIGTIVAGTIHVMTHGMEDWHPNPDFFFKPGGGPIMDMAPYALTNLIHLIGPVERVAALVTMPRQTRTIGHAGHRQGEAIHVETPTNSHALLAMRSGATVTLSASWDVHAHRHGCMELYGSEGTLFLPDPNYFGGALDHADASGMIAPLAPLDHPLGEVNESHHALGSVANYRSAGLADLAQSIRAGRPHLCSLDLALHVTDIMTSINAAAETRRWVETTTRCDRPRPLTAAEARSLLV